MVVPLLYPTLYPRGPLSSRAWRSPGFLPKFAAWMAQEAVFQSILDIHGVLSASSHCDLFQGLRNLFVIVYITCLCLDDPYLEPQHTTMGY